METLFHQILIKSINFIGVCGILLIFYGIVTELCCSTWKPLEKWADMLSTIVTLFATFVTAISIYVPSNPKEPEDFSKFVSAPVVCLAVLVAVSYITLKRKRLHPHVLNGFALLALSGALFRLINQ